MNQSQYHKVNILDIKMLDNIRYNLAYNYQKNAMPDQIFEISSK